MTDNNSTLLMAINDGEGNFGDLAYHLNHHLVQLFMLTHEKILPTDLSAGSGLPLSEVELALAGEGKKENMVTLLGYLDKQLEKVQQRSAVEEG